MKPNLTNVLKRFVVDGFPALIACDEGWHQLIVSLDIELSKIDSNYTVVQIKEKFGTLRYYIASDATERKLRKMHKIIQRYEYLSSKTCEKTGGPGVLMYYKGLYKTLDPSIAPKGYEIVNRP